jgi:hypothetical protein
MPAPDPADLGPLAALVGTWEGDEGVDIAFGNREGRPVETPFRERAVFNPFGPVDNGTQCLFGLDYRMSAWRSGEDDPFHTEVGYWLWDAADNQVMRCFMVPRGSTLIAGGLVAPDATTFTLQAEAGSETYGILSNPYLAKAARTVLYQVTVTVEGDELRYDQNTVVELARTGEAFSHTDRNVLRRVG